MSKVATLNIRMTTEEKEAARALAEYLHKAGKIKSDSLSEVMRLCLRFTIDEIMKGIEAERMGAR